MKTTLIIEIYIDKKYNNVMKKTRSTIFSIFWIFVSILILVVAGFLILIANGYKINWNNFKIQKTGMIFLRSIPKDPEIWVNNEFAGARTPFKYSEILPGRYDVKLVKYGYVDWHYTFYVEPGMVSSNEYIRMFLSEPIQIEPTEQEILSLENLFVNWQPKGLEIQNENEVWFNDVLITRFSDKVKNIRWHSDLKHIFFQINNEIRVMEPDGANNTKLVELTSDDVSTFVPLNNSKFLLYSDGDEIKKIQIE